MQYNLYEDENTDAETLNHFLTTLESCLDGAEYCREIGAHKDAKQWRNKALQELKDYIDCLFIQRNRKGFNDWIYRNKNKLIPKIEKELKKINDSD